MPLVTPKVPDNLIEIMKDLAKNVIQENPENIYEYSAIYFENLLKKRDGEMDKNYQRFNNIIRKDSKNTIIGNIEGTKKVGNKPSPPPQQPPPKQYDDILGQVDETSYIKAALKIQNAFRDFILKKKLQSTDIGSNANEKEILAAKVIQSAFKRYLDVRQHKKLSIISEEDSKIIDISEKSVNVDEVDVRHVIASDAENISACDVSEEPTLLIEDIGPDENDEKLEIILAKRIDILQNTEKDNTDFEDKSNILPEKINDDIQTEKPTNIDITSNLIEEKCQELEDNSDITDYTLKLENNINITVTPDSDNIDVIQNIKNLDTIDANMDEFSDNQINKDKPSNSIAVTLEEKAIKENIDHINVFREDSKTEVITETDGDNESRTVPKKLPKLEEEIVESEITIEILTPNNSALSNEVSKSNNEPDDSDKTLVDSEVINTSTNEEYKTEMEQSDQNKIIESSQIIKASSQQNDLKTVNVEEEDSNIAIQESSDNRENIITSFDVENVDQMKDTNEFDLNNLENAVKITNDEKLDFEIIEQSKGIEELQKNTNLEYSDSSNVIDSMVVKIDKLQDDKIITLESIGDVDNQINTEESMKSEMDEADENLKVKQNDVKRAATSIQKTYRGYRVRRNKENDEKNKIIEEQEESQIKILNSVLIIQKMYRGFRARKLLTNNENNLDDSEEPDRNLSTAETIEISDDHVNLDESMQHFNLKSPFGCEDYEVYQDQTAPEVTDDDNGDKMDSMSQFGKSPLGCEDYDLYQQDLNKLTTKNEKNKSLSSNLKIEYVGEEEKIKIQGDSILPEDVTDTFIVVPDGIIEDDGTETQAAIKLQKNYRGYIVRRDIKTKNNQSNGVDDLNKLALSDSNANITCDEDKVEDKVEGETVINMALQLDDEGNATSQGDNLDLHNTCDEHTIEIKIKGSPNVDLEIADVIMKADSQGDHVIISSENIENISEISFTEPEVNDVITKSLEADVKLRENTQISTLIITDAIKMDENDTKTIDINRDEVNNSVITEVSLSTAQSENIEMHIGLPKYDIENINDDNLPNQGLGNASSSITNDENADKVQNTQITVQTLFSQNSLDDKNIKDIDHVEIDVNRMSNINNQIIHKHNEPLKSFDDKKTNLIEELLPDKSDNNKDISNKKLISDSEDANAETTDAESKDNEQSTDLTGDEMDTSENQTTIDTSVRGQNHERDYSNQTEVVEEPFVQQIIERPVFEIKNSLLTDDESLNDFSGRDDLSEIENVDLSSYSKDSLEAMYYSLRKNELLLDRMHQRADDERNSSIDPFNLETESELDLPKEDDHDNDDSDEVSLTKQSRQSIADSDSDDIVLRKLSLESSRLLKDEIVSEVSKTPMIEEVEEFNDSLNIIENLLDDNQDVQNIFKEECKLDENVENSLEIRSVSPVISGTDLIIENNDRLKKEKIISGQNEKSYDLTEETDLVSELSDMDQIRRMGSGNNERRKSFALFKSNTIQIGAMPLLDSYDQDDDMHISSLERKILTSSLSETDSDYIDINDRKFGAVINDSDKNIKTALETIPSTDTDSTIVSAATRIQATARGFLTRRRLQKSSLTTTSISEVCHRSFGNSAINESLENFIEQQNNNLGNSDEQEELAAIKIQKKYRQYRDKKFNKQNVTIDTDFPSLDDKNDFLGVTEIKLEQRPEINSDNETELEGSLHEDSSSDKCKQHQLSNLLSVNFDDVHARRMTLQRGDAVQRNSTPDDSAASNNSPIAVTATTQDIDKTIDNSSIELDKETGENFSFITKSKQTTSADTLSSGSSYAGSTKSDSNVLVTKQRQQHKNELKTIRSLGPRQRSMPVQMDAFIIRILPKHLRKRVRSAGNNNKSNNNFHKNNKNMF